METLLNPMAIGPKSITRDKLSEDLQNQIGAPYDDSELRDKLSRKLEGEVISEPGSTEEIPGISDSTQIRNDIAALQQKNAEQDEIIEGALTLAEDANADVASLITTTRSHETQLTELSAEIGKKVDADFVNNAIAEAIGEAIDGGY